MDSLDRLARMKCWRSVPAAHPAVRYLECHAFACFHFGFVSKLSQLVRRCEKKALLLRPWFQNTQPQPNQQHGSFVDWLGQFCKRHDCSFPHWEVLPRLLPCTLRSSRRSIDGACWLGPQVALNCRMIFSTKHCLFIFSNWSMGISEAYRFGKAHCSDLCRQNQCMKVVEQTGNKGLRIDVDWPSNTHVDSVYHALDSWESRLIMSEHWAVKQLYRFHSILVAVLHRQVAWVLINKQHDFDSWVVCVANFSIFFHLIC